MPQRLGEPFPVDTLSIGVGLVAVAELLGQVLGQISDAPSGVFGPGEHTLGVELSAEPDHMQRLIIWANGVQGLVPGGQQLASGGVEVAAAGLIPDRQIVALEPDLICSWPPDLVGRVLRAVDGRGFMAVRAAGGAGSTPWHPADQPTASPRPGRKTPGPWNPAHPARQPGRQPRHDAENAESAAGSSHRAKITKDRG